MIGTLREGHLLPMSTPATRLRCIGRVNLSQLPASTFRLARQLSKERRPCSVTDRFRQTLVVNHAVHFQVFYTNSAKLVDHTAALLVSEVLPFPGNALMDAGHGLPVFVPRRRAFRQFGVFALDFRQRFLFGTEEAGILDFLSIREGCKGLQSNVNPHSGSRLRQVFWLHFTGKTHVPFAGRRPSNSTGFDCARNGAMIDHFHGANVGEAYPVIMCETKTTLRVGDAIIAPTAFEPGEARLFSCLAASEKGFKGQINTDSHILQHLRMNLLERGTFCFQDRKGCLLLVERQTLPILLIGTFAPFKQMVIEPATLFQGVIECSEVFFTRKQPIPESFTHVQILAQNRTFVKRQGRHPTLSTLKGRPIHPRPKRHGAFWAVFCKPCERAGFSLSTRSKQIRHGKTRTSCFVIRNVLYCQLRVYGEALLYKPT